MTRVTADFPMLDTSKAVAEVKRAQSNNRKLQECRVPTLIGGEVDCLMGIKYGALSPEPIHTLPSGLCLYRSKLQPHDGVSNAIIGGCHESFDWMVNVAGGVSPLIASFEASLRRFRDGYMPRISMNPISMEEVQAAKTHSLQLDPVEGLEELVDEDGLSEEGPDDENCVAGKDLRVKADHDNTKVEVEKSSPENSQIVEKVPISRPEHNLEILGKNGFPYTLSEGDTKLGSLLSNRVRKWGSSDALAECAALEDRVIAAKMANVVTWARIIKFKNNSNTSPGTRNMDYPLDPGLREQEKALPLKLPKGRDRMDLVKDLITPEMSSPVVSSYDSVENCILSPNFRPSTVNEAAMADKMKYALDLDLGKGDLYLISQAIVCYVAMLWGPLVFNQQCGRLDNPALGLGEQVLPPNVPKGGEGLYQHSGSEKENANSACDNLLGKVKIKIPDYRAGMDDGNVLVEIAALDYFDTGGKGDFLYTSTSLVYEFRDAGTYGHQNLDKRQEMSLLYATHHCEGVYGNFKEVESFREGLKIGKFEQKPPESARKGRKLFSPVVGIENGFGNDGSAIRVTQVGKAELNTHMMGFREELQLLGQKINCFQVEFEMWVQKEPPDPECSRRSRPGVSRSTRWWSAPAWRRPPMRGLTVM